MRMPIMLSWFALSTFFIGGCTNLDVAPKVRAESVELSEGEAIVVDGESQTKSQEHIRFSAPQSGVMFVLSTIFPAQDNALDTSGLRRIYLFVPERFVLTAKEGEVVSISRTDGLLAMEYSKNDAFPGKYCFQQLSVGTISLHAKDGSHEIVIESLLKTPPVSGSIDARCGASKFMITTAFPLPHEAN